MKIENVFYLPSGRIFLADLDGYKIEFTDGELGLLNTNFNFLTKPLHKVPEFQNLDDLILTILNKFTFIYHHIYLRSFIIYSIYKYRYNP
jgi:hypothetical protein